MPSCPRLSDFRTECCPRATGHGAAASLSKPRFPSLPKEGRRRALEVVKLPLDRQTLTFGVKLQLLEGLLRGPASCCFLAVQLSPAEGQALMREGLPVAHVTAPSSDDSRF